ncbi:phage tail tape measure protein [Streptomyces sp. NPDC050844]|uniref:phage tail tape measure protein n=1 Tax=Streptomyces sp. NPDC050844 TaxID=3155790 RepID=UPI00340823AA
MGDTSLVFNLVARDNASATVERFKERISTAAAGIGAGVAAALGVGVAANLNMEAAGDKLAAQLGIGPAKAAELSKVSASVYEAAWGDSIETVNEAVKGVYTNIGDTSKAEGGLEGVTTKALALADTFGQEVGPTTAAVGQMLKTGLADNADEAFDILTRGFQTGANKADDLLDTVGEYGTQWRKFGLDGETAMGLLSQGLKAGARDADIVADSIKEFSIRAIDGSKTTADGFKAIGLDAGTMAAKIAKGGDSASGALDLTLDRLRAIKDPVKRSAAAVQLFGTQSEDLGEALYALDPSKAVDTIGKVGGAADKMVKTVGDNPKAALESFKRQAIGRLAEIAGAFVKFALDNQAVMVPLAYTLGGVALAVLAIKGGMMAWAAAQAVWTAATTIATGAQWLWNTALFSSPITWIILAILALVAVIVIIATKTTWFQQLWTAVWGGIRTAISATWTFIRDSVFGPMGRFFTETIPRWAGMVRDRVSGAWASAKSRVQTTVGDMVSWVRTKWNGFVDFFAKLPSRIGKVTGSMFNGVKTAFKSAINWIIAKWNNFSFTIGGGSVMGVDIPQVTLGTPNIPYLAKGGLINRAGMAMVGERGPELLSLPKGAGVTPLSRAGSGPTVLTVRYETSGAYDELLRLVRKMVVVEGGGDVQSAFGRGPGKG